MKQTDILSGRIIQRVLSELNSENSEATVVYGIDEHKNIERLIENLFEYFPDGTIVLQKCQFGYELKITVKL